MAYAFNEDKSKVDVYTTDDVYSKDEVYTKNEIDSRSSFVVITTSVSVSGHGSSTKTLSASELANAGINSVNNYELIAVSQTISGEAGRKYCPAYSDISSGQSYRPPVDPTFSTTSNGELLIIAYNPKPDTRTITYRLVFMKVA